MAGERMNGGIALLVMPIKKAVCRLLFHRCLLGSRRIVFLRL